MDNTKLSFCTKPCFLPELDLCSASLTCGHHAYSHGNDKKNINTNKERRPTQNGSDASNNFGVHDSQAHGDANTQAAAAQASRHATVD